MVVMQRQQLGLVQELLAATVLGLFVGSILASTLLLVVTAWWLLIAPWSPWSWSLAVLAVTITVIPLWDKNGPFADALMTYCCSCGEHYFPVTVVCDQGAVFSTDKTYVVGLEPHSALPTSIPSVFGLQARMLPAGLRGRTYGLASSICFQIPLVRHMYWWIGIRPITRHWMKKLLQHRKNVVLVPGGVQECLYMQKGSETAFLKKRKGFIRIAMQNGSAVVPCFAFGQSGTYSWCRPGPPLVSDAFVQALSRKMGMVPMLLMGRWGTPAPINSPMTVVFGKPIEVPQLEHPSDELLQQYLDQYISSMQDIFDKHKAAAGYADYTLHIM